ncbi:MAG: ABC transporter ATP-binding protein [Desulfurococcales archaeon]|nr:ABC transporter ATP-binding protein [Desulfurococcales archaeon]
MNNFIITVKNLTKIYKNGVKANVNISFNIREGEIFSILGPNGAGKTTLIKQLAGLLKPTSGSIIVSGVDVIRNPNAVKEYISLCPQESAIIEHLTVFEHLYYFGRLKGLSSDKARKETNSLISKFDLKKYRDQYVGSLSKGLQRRIIVAQAFLGSSKIVYLDEPTTHLDPVGRRHVWSIIREYKKDGTTILLATHFMDEAERLSDRILFLNNGRIVALGSIRDIKKLVGNYVKIRIDAYYGEEITKLLDRIKGFYKISKYSGSFIDIIVPGEDDEVEKLIDFLISRRIEFELRMPSLEDVFLELSENESKKGIN